MRYRDLLTFAGCIAALAYGAAGITIAQQSKGQLFDVLTSLGFCGPSLIMLPAVVLLGAARVRPQRALLYLAMGIIGQYVTPTNNVEIETSLVLLVFVGSLNLAVAYAGFLVVTSFKEWADRSRGGRNR
jgi:predicted membrane channel-forming protein YqfA (hemolysin III family)